jgi:thiamine biosynthesis lipoprotein
MARKSSRRDFLKGNVARDATADAASAAARGDALNDRQEKTPAPSYLVHVSRRAMACEFQVFLNAGQYEQTTELALKALDLVVALEAQMSVFRESSEISEINRTAADRPVPVEPRLFELLELAAQIHRQTEGALDITSGPLWEVWGFSRRAGRVPTDEQIDEARRCVGGDLMELDPREKTVRFRRPGVEINLGSMGKGYALDRVADMLLEASVNDFLIHGGQSSVLARGSRSDDLAEPRDASDGWIVGVAHPLRRGVRLAQVRLVDRALATSGSAVQSFRHQGRRYGHVLDPRTGRPAEGVLSATAIAPGAALADALSTAFLVMGHQQALEYCRSRPDLGALLVCPALRGPGIEIHIAGLEEHQVEILQEW